MASVISASVPALVAQGEAGASIASPGTVSGSRFALLGPLEAAVAARNVLYHIKVPPALRIGSLPAQVALFLNF
jgi:hypothetical protein